MDDNVETKSEPTLGEISTVLGKLVAAMRDLEVCILQTDSNTPVHEVMEYINKLKLGHNTIEKFLKEFKTDNVH
jgi:hypothetical protein